MNKWTVFFLATTALLNGLLTGGNVDRLLVATPAWEEVGLNSWADFSRAADLGHGQVVYPVLALGSTALAVLAAVLCLRRSRSAPGVMLPVGLSAALMIIALPFSLKAVPFMQSLRLIHDGDVAGLSGAFAGAHFWGRFQGYFHFAAFCSQLWAIAAVAGFAREPLRGSGERRTS